MIRMTIDSSTSVKPALAFGHRRRLRTSGFRLRQPTSRSLSRKCADQSRNPLFIPSSQILAVDVCVLSLASLLAVGTKTLEHEVLPIAQVHVGIPPRIFGNLPDVALWVVLPQLRATGRLAHEGRQTLGRGRIDAGVELEEMEALLDLLEIRFGLGDAGIVGLADHVDGDDRREQTDDEDHDQNLDQREAGSSAHRVSRQFDVQARSKIRAAAGSRYQRDWERANNDGGSLIEPVGSFGKSATGSTAR